MQPLPESHPSNIFTYCPKCGTKGLTFNGIKVFSCPACGLRYYINPAPAVAIVLEYFDGSIVLTRRKHEPRQGFLDLPGGFVEMNESIEDAVKREIFEELKVTVGEMNYFGSFPNEYVYKGISYFTCDMAFVCPIEEHVLLHPSDDVSEALTIKPNDIDHQQISFPSISNILRLYINNKLK